MNFKILLVALIAIVLYNTVEAKVIRVGFCYTSSIYDVSWTYTHEVARRAVDGHYRNGVNVKTEYKEIPVPSTQLCDDLCFNETKRFINLNQFDLVALAGSAYAPVNHLLADLYPHIKFIQSTSAPKQSRPNLSGYLAYIEQVRFLAGAIAGLTSVSGEIGYVTVNRQQQVLRQFNAFAFGVRKVRPNAKIHLISGNKFGDASADRKAVEQMLEYAPAIDVVSFQSLFAEVSRVACERNISSVGYGSDIGKFVPGGTVLTSAMWDWEPAYRHFIDQFVHQNKRPFTWDNTVYDGDISNGAIALGQYSPRVSQATSIQVDQLLNNIIAGTEKMWCGSDAAAIVAPATPNLPGNCLDRSQMANALLLVPNITDLGNANLARVASPQQSRCWIEPTFDN